MGEFITPDVLPEDTFCRVLLIPNDPKWIGAVSGALLPMIYPSEWVSFGGLTPEETAARCEVMLQEFWASNGCEDAMCCDDKVIIHRFNPDTGRPEVSKDGGTTWTPDPADTQNAIPLQPPLVKEGGSSTKCDAATNASQHVNELITATAENLTTASDVFTLGIGIAEALLALFLIIVSAGSLTAPVTAVATAIWAATTSLFALGIDAYNAYWSTDKQDAILCALYCHIGENGQFSESEYQAFLADVKSTLPSSPALDIILTSINAGGARGLSQMASYGNAALSDCASCDCDDCETVAYIPTGGGVLVGRPAPCVIDVSSVPESGNQVVYLWFNNNTDTFNPNACGKVISIENLSGTVVSKGFNDCVTGNLHYPDNPEEHCVCQLYLVGSAPFTARVTYADC